MPGGFPIDLEVCRGIQPSPYYAGSLGSLAGNGINPGVANTKSAWGVLAASCPSDISFIVFNAVWSNPSTNPGTIAFDIGVGAAGSEIVIAQNLIVNAPQAWWSGREYQIPCSIVAGSRVALRYQMTGTTGDLYASIISFDGGFNQGEGFAGIDALGFNSSTTLGTAITPGAANVKGSYAQVVAATAKDYVGIMGTFDTNGANAASAYYQLIDIAIGASGSEQVIIPDYFVLNYVGLLSPSGFGFLPINIPAGSRLSARLQNSSGTTPVVGLTLYGVYR